MPAPPPTDPALSRWFLARPERGNDATMIDRRHSDGAAWTTGNLVTPIIHGANYFRELHDELSRLQPGDRVYFTDWRGDGDEQLLPGGPTVRDLLCERAAAGVEVRGLIWRSHSDTASFSSQENARFGAELNEAGGEVLFDQRVRRFGSHHQKLVVIRHRDDPAADVAFVGGIDLCHGRRDDERHLGDPQQQPMSDVYGLRAGWHDAALRLQGLVVGDLLETFVERWDDDTPLDRRTPYRMLIQRREGMPRHPRDLPERFPDPPPAGPHAVQLLRTYAAKRPRYPFAPHGERSVARAYAKAFRLARSFIYVEDQYLWSEPVAEGLAEALRREPDLRLLAVVPRYPDADGAVMGPPNRIGQLRAMELLHDAGADRVAVYDLVNVVGTPIYVHAKICIVDDVWLTCGSDNFNRRSWTSDSELTCAVLDPRHDERPPLDLGGSGDHARVLPRKLRLQLWAEHLGRSPDDKDLLDPHTGFDVWRQSAQRLDDWYRCGEPGPRPAGHARPHRPRPVSRRQRVWAQPLYRLVYDPDGRSWRQRRARAF